MIVGRLVQLLASIEMRHSALLESSDGSVVRYVDMPPGHTSPMHRTTSIDYGFVLFGSIEVG